MASPFASVSRSLAFRCGRQAPFPISDLLETTKCARQPLNQTVWPSGWHSQPRYFLSDLSCGRADQIEHFQTTRFASLTRSCVTQTSFDPSLRSTRSTSPCHYRPSNRLRTTPSQRLPIAQVQSFATSPQRPFFWPFRNKSRSQSKETQKEYKTPYRPKREWPPDMSQLSKEQRFRLERKYRRRAKLKYERPNWDKWTKIVQWSLIGFVLVYAVFFMEMKDAGTNPFHGIREYLRKQLNDPIGGGGPDPRLSKETLSSKDRPHTSQS